ncbi:MAG: Nif3-like dinuclear metal center hexameric protein [Planctomycetes bacterium]|nr:Nif3-like dinuclear metal center hexameric protein [Planctomycetota bacterium]
MKLKEITPVLEAMAPLHLAEEWDNVGLLAGDYEMPVKNIMLTIDMTQAVFEEARKKNIDLILAYHPPLWEPLKKIIAGRGASPLLHEAIRRNMAIYALHTALDSVRGGVNDVLADMVGIADSQILLPPKTQNGTMCKLVVYLPESDLAQVREAIFTAGAGHTGDYQKCSFRSRGIGTFQGGAETNPTIGKAGQFEQADELRLETIVPTDRIGPVVKAMIKAHSYQEVAYDIFPMIDGPKDQGLGRFGELSEAISVDKLVALIKKKLKINSVGIISPRRGRVKRAAVCAGSCGAIFRDVIRQNCDFYLTGELKHHHALEAQQAGLTTVCVGHSNSERIVLPVIAKQLRQKCRGVEIFLSKKDHDPIIWD